MEYQDLTIDLRSAESGGFEARIAEVPLGVPLKDCPWVGFSEPLERSTLERVHRSFDVPGGQLQDKASPMPFSSRDIGKQLFASLFQDELAESFRSCRDAVCQDEEHGLRLRLRFETNDQEAEYLAALPWEWMQEPGTGEYLALDRCTPVVREIATPRIGRAALEIESPLRILVVDAMPASMKKLGLRLEIERMRKALGELVSDGRVELLRLAQVTPNGLRDAVLDDGIHILHFMGHGGYHPLTGDGAIFFEKDDGTTDQVDGEELGAFLKRSPKLRLVVLNSCKTARHKGCAGAPLSAGVASAVLERSGMPAVVANQYSISDAVAIAWSEHFYCRLAKGDGVEEAMTEARLRLWRDSLEWATPILFLNGPERRILIPKEPRRGTSIPLAASRPDGGEVRLGVRSFVGYGRDMENRNDKLLELERYFQDRFIKDKAGWQERVLPELRDFLKRWVVEGRPLVLDFAAHSSIAFAAGWLLEPKSGLDVRVRQRTGGETEIDWHPKEGGVPEGALWGEHQDIWLDPAGPDVAVALSVSQPKVAEQVEAFIRTTGLPVGRIVDASVPEPSQSSVLGGAHALRLAQMLLARLKPKYPHERGGRIHFFCAAPNALSFYLGQLSTSLGDLVLYEYPFRAKDAYGRYQKSIELPPPGESLEIPEDW